MVEILKQFKHTFQDYPDPKESSVTVFFTRCEHRCPGCHNWQLVDVDESHIINRSRYQMKLFFKVVIHFIHIIGILFQHFYVTMPKNVVTFWSFVYLPDIRSMR
jgi:hypothetical protein